MSILQDILRRFKDVKKTKAGWSACCPAHEDETASLSIAVGDDGRLLLHCHAGCTVEAICAAIGLQTKDLFPAAVNGKAKRQKIEKAYDYRDEEGHLRYQVCRMEPKGFRQRQPGSGNWKWNLDGVRLVLYRLPELLADTNPSVLVAEGERDVDNARDKLGIPATCNPGGAGKWRDEYSEFFRGRHVLIIADNDDAGLKHALSVARSLWGKAASIRILVLPGVPPKGDLSDWIAAGGTKEKLIELARDCQPWQPTTADSSLAAVVETKECEAEPVEYVPFPTDLLPSPVREFVEAGAKALGCDPAYVALPLLAALASAVGNTRRIKIKGTWCEPCVLWMVIIGESGTLKSPALDLALEYVRRRQAAELREYRDAVREYEQWMRLYDADLAEWKKKGAKERQLPPVKPEPPIWRQRLVEDVTAEASAELLQDQPRGVLLARDELAGWINSFDAYKSSHGADVAHWLSMHRAGSVLVNRKTGKKLIWAPRAAVSVCGGVQPVTLAAALAGRYSPTGPEQMEKPPSEHFANGFAARLLFASPPRVPKRWTDADLDDAVRSTMQRLFDDLFSLEAPVDENGELVPVDLPMSPEAKRLWVSFYNAHANEQTGLEGDLAAAWSKGEGYALRFALLFELIADPRSEAIGVGSMEAGIELARWFVDEAARVYADLGGDVDDPDAHELRELLRVVDWMRSRGGAATARDLTRGPSRYRGKADEAEQTLRKLEEAGAITKVRGETKKQGGRPTQWYVVADMSLMDVAPLFQPDDCGDGDETISISEKPEVMSPSPVSPTKETENRVHVTI